MWFIVRNSDSFNATFSYIFFILGIKTFLRVFRVCVARSTNKNEIMFVLGGSTNKRSEETYTYSTIAYCSLFLSRNDKRHETGYYYDLSKYNKRRRPCLFDLVSSFMFLRPQSTRDTNRWLNFVPNSFVFSWHDSLFHYSFVHSTTLLIEKLKKKYFKTKMNVKQKLSTQLMTSNIGVVFQSV